MGFFADGRLKRRSLGDGAPQILAEAPAAEGASWSRDDVILFGGTASGLMRVAATGGTPTKATFLAPGEGSHRFPEFLPDGRHFLFFIQSGRNSKACISIAEGTDPHRVLAAETAAVYSPPGWLLTLRKGNLLAFRFDEASGVVSGEPIAVAEGVGSDLRTWHGAFSVSAVGLLAHRSSAPVRRQLVWFDRRGTRMGSLGRSDDLLGNPELAPDGRHLAVVRSVQGNADIWVIDTSTGVESRFTFDPGIDGAAVWAPDGSRLMFGSNRNGPFDLFQKNASGERDEQRVLTSSSNKAPADWSSDGHLILYESQEPKTPDGPWELWVLPLGSTRPPFPFLQSKFDEAEGQFSPNGKWVAYRSNESGPFEIYVRSFPTHSGQRQISVGGGSHPRWRRDGKELFYIAPDDKLMAASIGASSKARLWISALQYRCSRHTLSDFGQPKPQYVVDRDGQRFLMNAVVSKKRYASDHHRAELGKGWLAASPGDTGWH